MFDVPLRSHRKALFWQTASPKSLTDLETGALWPLSASDSRSDSCIGCSRTFKNAACHVGKCALSSGLVGCLAEWRNYVL